MNTDSLIDYRTQLRAGLEELDKIELLAAEAKREVDQIIASGQLDAEAKSPRYATAALTLQMLPSRKAHVTKAVDAVATQARRELRNARSLWNKAVASKRQQLFAQVCESLGPHFEGGQAGLEREVKKLNIPTLRAVERATAHDSMRSETTPADVLVDVENFLAHIKRHAALIEGA